MKWLAYISTILMCALIACWIVSEWRDDVFSSGGARGLIVGQAQGFVLIGFGEMAPESHHQLFRPDPGNLVGQVVLSYETFGEIGVIAWADIWGDNNFRGHKWHAFYLAEEDIPEQLGPNRCIIFPHWGPLVLTLPALAVAGMTRVRTVHRRHKQYCIACGYDVRATPKVCPECGTAVERV